MIPFSTRTSLLWEYSITLGQYSDVLNWCRQTLKFPGFKRIVTINPFIVVDCASDSDLKKWVNTADLIIPDGNGICWALHKRNHIRQVPLTGIQLALHLLQDGVSVYLIGAEPGVPEKASAYIARHFPKSMVLGFHHGYMTHQHWEQVAADIDVKKPDIILVGMGFPKQEYFIQFLSHRIRYGIAIGVGGVLDVLAGHVEWAPKWVRDLKCEWLFRALKQPKRMRQWGKLLLFVKKVWFGP